MSGKLIMNALVMYDHQTDTLWSQFLGEAVKGPLEGTRLDIIPAQLTSWREWRDQHPDTFALDKGFNTFSRDSYESYYFSGQAGIIGESNRDDRLFTKELVVGITGVAGQKAYAYRHLSRQMVINDTFDGRELVVVLASEVGATAVFDRATDGKTLTFEQADDELLMTDTETGSTWRKSSGKAIEGPMKGKQLEQVPSFASFWFAWSDFHPQTEVYTP